MYLLVENLRLKSPRFAIFIEVILSLCTMFRTLILELLSVEEYIRFKFKVQTYAFVEHVNSVI